MTGEENVYYLLLVVGDDKF